jgi:hypothetical protein
MVRTKYFTENGENKNNIVAAALVFLGVFLLFVATIIGIHVTYDILENGELSGDLKKALKSYSYSGLHDPHYADTSCNYGFIYEVQTDWYRDSITGKRYDDAILWIYIRGNNPRVIKCKSCYK